MDLRSAAKTPETIIALMARHLAVPPRPDEHDKAAMERYLAQWYEPALWICHDTDDLEPRRAWEVTERRLVGMLRGPTWYAGTNWGTVWKELEKKQWWPDAMTPYDGPLLTEYLTGYTGVTQANNETPVPEPPIVVEAPEVPRQPWMTRHETVALCDAICDAHPELNPALTPLDGVTDRWYASLQWGQGKDDWHDLKCPDDWRNPSPETAHALALAQSYAAARSAPDPGGADVPEACSPIVLEPESDVVPETTSYVSMEQIEADLRALRPVVPPPPVAVVPVVVAPPVLPGKTGMSLLIAGLLLDQIASAGYAVQLREEAGRATLRVEASPGAWIDIDSGVAWQRHLKSVAQSPPGSVAAVLAMAGMGQRVEVAQ
jgi:hypothetical protein